ncbi:MAG: hypothetical protein ABEI52_11640 [Halobacteriaceae archaeon]
MMIETANGTFTLLEFAGICIAICGLSWVVAWVVHPVAVYPGGESA